MAPFELCELMPSELERYENDLALVLQACVANGASVGFVLPFSIEEAAAYWRTSVFPSVRQGGRLLYAAKVQGLSAGRYCTGPNDDRGRKGAAYRPLVAYA